MIYENNKWKSQRQPNLRFNIFDDLLITIKLNLIRHHIRKCEIQSVFLKYKIYLT